MKINLTQKLALVFSDIISLYISFSGSVFLLDMLRPGGQSYIRLDNVGFSKLAGLVIILVFWYQEQYSKRRPMWEEMLLLYKTIIVFALLHFGLSFILSHHVVKMVNVVFWGTVCIILPLSRYLVKRLLLKFKLWERKLYIISEDSGHVDLVKNAMLSSKILGYKFIKSLSFGNGSFQEILSFSNDNIEIIIAVPFKQLATYHDKINHLQINFSFVSIMPDIEGLSLYGAEINHFFGEDKILLRLCNNLGRRSNYLSKRLFDMVCSLLALSVLLIPFILYYVLIKFFAGGNVFFKHKRLGRGGKEFSCLKFQTMYANSQEILENLLATDQNAKAEWEKDFKLKNDPRITTIGKFLRKTSLDELPQLWNVLLGDMSLVGPRPIVKQEVVKYEADGFYYYSLVRPGITGIWQVSGRNDIDYQNRVKLDMWYVKNWSLWQDIVILLRTIIVVFMRKGAY